MANAGKKRKAIILGVGLDSDGNRRVTTGPNFALVGGTEETHELMTEKQRGKHLEEVSAKEFDDLAGEVGLQPVKPRDKPRS
jgi:hypothetical protein